MEIVIDSGFSGRIDMYRWNPQNPAGIFVVWSGDDGVPVGVFQPRQWMVGIAHECKLIDIGEPELRNPFPAMMTDTHIGWS